MSDLPNNYQDYVIGKYILIKRLKNIRAASQDHADNDKDLKYNKSDTLNIRNIQIYGYNSNVPIKLVDKNESSNIPNKVSVTSDYGTSQWIIKNALQNTANKDPAIMYHSALEDRAPTIIIELDKEQPISLIYIQGRINFDDRLTNVYVEILDVNKKIKFRTVIRNKNYISGNVVKINTVGINCNRCYIDFKSTLPPPTNAPTYPPIIPQCTTKINVTEIKTKIDDIKTKINKINSNIPKIINLMNNIYNSCENDLKSFVTRKNDYDARLSNIQIDIATRDGTVLETLSIIDEGFTNYTSKSDPISSNNILQYKSSQRDQKLELFANFIQPKVNVYENFQNDWKNDNTFGIKYVRPEIKKYNNNVDTDIPFVRKQNFEENINNITTDLLNKRITYQKDKMNSFWYNVK